MTNPVFSEFKRSFLSASSLNKFIVINLIVFIAVKLVKLVYFLVGIDAAQETFVRFLAVPSSLEVLLLRPWTIFTYMFFHLEFMHILFNMIVLYFGGRIFSEYLGNKKFISTYILGGIAGAIFYIVAFNIFPVFESVKTISIALGASASVLAILVAAATFVPNYTVHLIFIGPVKLKFIAVFLVVLDLLSIESGNPGGHIAHLGGAVYGFIFVSRLKRGKNVAGWFDKIADFFATVFNSKPRMKVAYTNKKRSDEEYNVLKISRQQRVDDILDKISKSGYDSLTKEEKEFLFKESKNL